VFEEHGDDFCAFLRVCVFECVVEYIFALLVAMVGLDVGVFKEECEEGG
jgi:hypothetical protein